MKRHAAFTLIELLVVVAIIIILIAVMMPALSRAREASKQTVCAANQRQIGTILLMYANEIENQMYFPPIRWGENQVLYGNAPDYYKDGWIDQYFKSFKALRCPSAPLLNLVSGGNSYYDPHYNRAWTTYFFVAGVGGNGPHSGADINGRVLYKVSTPTDPGAPLTRLSDCGAFVGGSNLGIYGPSLYYASADSQPIIVDQCKTKQGVLGWNPFGYTSTLYPPNHERGVNITYADGHTEWKAMNNIQKRFNDYYNSACW